MSKQPYSPVTVFAEENRTPPRVFVSPQRYVQGAGVIDRTGHYIHSLMDVKRAAILASRRGLGAQGAQVADSLGSKGVDSVNAEFNGECSAPEIDAQVAQLVDRDVDCLIAVGGGKVADAGRCIAYRLDVPVVVVPTLAATDAPCSALSLVYTPDGITDHVEFFPQNPAIVIVDTDVVANASERYLVAGMGDAMATWYEAKVCLENSAARNMLGGRPTLASCAVGEICAHTLFEHGETAARSVRASENNDSVDKVVEANTLLSGLGFESGGLALAHALAVCYPEIKVVHDNYLHGEMVAMGTLAQLVMEKSADTERVARFFARVGLPVHLGQLSLSVERVGELDPVIDAAVSRPIAHNMPMTVNEDSVRQAILDAHKLGVAISKDVGDEAYKRLQN